MGLRRIEEKLTQEAELKRKGTKLALKSLEELSQKVHQLHDELQKLEKTYEGDFKKNPQLAQRLMLIREELGLPKALGIYEVGKKPGMIDKLKGKDDYLNYISLRIIEIGKDTRLRTGGLLSVSELLTRLNDESKGITISINDMNSALKMLEENGMIHAIKKLAGIKIVEFLDPKLSDDHQLILDLAAQYNGEIGLSELLRKTSWTIERVNTALDSLIKQRIAIKSDSLDGVIISFPAI